MKRSGRARKMKRSNRSPQAHSHARAPVATGRESVAKPPKIPWESRGTWPQVCVPEDALRQLEVLLPGRREALRVVLSSRRDPRLGLQQLRVAGDLTEIRTADLRFTPEETRALLGSAGRVAARAGRVDPAHAGAVPGDCPRRGSGLAFGVSGARSPRSPTPSPAADRLRPRPHTARQPVQRFVQRTPRLAAVMRSWSGAGSPPSPQRAGCPVCV